MSDAMGSISNMLITRDPVLCLFGNLKFGFEEFIWNFAQRMVIWAWLCHIYMFILYAYLKICSSKKGIGRECGDVIILIDIHPFDIYICILQTLFHHAKCYDKTQIRSHTCLCCRLQHGRICWCSQRWMRGCHRGRSFQSHGVRFRHEGRYHNAQRHYDLYFK